MTKSVFTDAYRTFLKLMIETRREASVHQSELADRIRWDQPTISNAERGIRRLDVIEFVTIAKALDVDPVELMAELVRRLPDKIEI